MPKPTSAVHGLDIFLLVVRVVPAFSILDLESNTGLLALTPPIPLCQLQFGERHGYRSSPK